MRNINSESVMKEITNQISSKLNDIGLLFRIFSRTKATESINKKIQSNPDYGKNKKLQDLIGIRIVLYFNDDIDTVRRILATEFSERSKDVSIDEFTNDEFKAVRYNIVYSLSENHIETLNLGEHTNLIDHTFELQIRTIFSEGWHEVEHDLRYKCKTDWNNFDQQSRRLNGVYASLETSEWTMIKIFDELSYNHYKNGDWPAMFRQKFRLRLIDSTLEEELQTVFRDKELVKRFFRLDRSELLMDMCKYEYYYPVTLSNLIYFANMIKIKDPRILEITPLIMTQDFRDHEMREALH